MPRRPHLVHSTCLLLGGLAALAAYPHRSAAVEPPRPDNTPPEGYLALFNGKDLTHWQGLLAGRNENPVERAKRSPQELTRLQAEADQLMRDHWQVTGGMLVYDGHGSSLATAKEYGDFELYVDWKIEAGGDSGIYVRGSPQIQIWDTEAGSGGLYNNQKNPSKPLVVADRPVGEWNTFWIRMVGERVTVKLNGILVVDNVVLENYWDRQQPIFPRGPIELQHHGSKLYFKNIYLKEL